MIKLSKNELGLLLAAKEVSTYNLIQVVKDIKECAINRTRVKVVREICCKLRQHICFVCLNAGVLNRILINVRKGVKND